MKFRRFWPLKRGPVVPVVRLSGVIGSMPGRNGLTLAAVEAMLAQAFAHKSTDTVAILVNSPGGSPVQSALIGEKIRLLAERKKKRVLAFAEDVAASGGYWLLCAGDEMFAHRCSLIGSIGVISAGFGFTEAIAKLGIERRIRARGERKALLDPFRPQSPQDLELLDEIQADIHHAFIEHVRARRGGRLTGDDSEIFSGRVWSGARAQALGLVDTLGTPEAVLRARFGDELRLRAYGRRRSWLQRRLGMAGLGGELLDLAEERLAFARFGL
ncbi:S49 family peptidase [Geminicoccus flavidas]|uniref:S49 family peptidase n=1 Tax=Geminicoccus flavidas TaxID=2506407 RepID=UPI001359C516|nr:S49 family peptidase [Geminicoccus flavidas]